MLLGTLVLSGCSLDGEYFDARQVSSYQLAGATNIPTAQVEQVTFTSNGNTIHGVFVKAATFEATTNTIIYFHGDDKDIDKYWSNRVDALYPLGANVFIFDYQGFGRSTGKSSLSALRQNSRDALAYVLTRADVNATRIIYYGFSLGGIFAIDLAVARTPYALITENAPSSSDAVVHNTIRLGLPGSFFFNETFDNLEKIGKVQAPVLLMSAENDETAPFEGNGKLLFEAARQPKTTVKVAGAGHSDVITRLGQGPYRTLIQNFLSGI